MLESPVLVYNFTVEDYHSYYVSSSNVLVHNTSKAKAKKKSKQSGKKKASNAPDWAKHAKYNPDKSADWNARNVLNQKYGKGNWSDKTNTEYSKIKKWLQRSKGFK